MSRMERPLIGQRKGVVLLCKRQSQLDAWPMRFAAFAHLEGVLYLASPCTAQQVEKRKDSPQGAQSCACPVC